MVYVKELNNSIGIFFAFNMIIGQIFLTKMFMVLYINSLLNSRLIKELLELDSVFSTFIKKIKTNLIEYFYKNNDPRKPSVEYIRFYYLIIYFKTDWTCNEKISRQKK